MLTPKTHQLSSVHTSLEKVENATITDRRTDWVFELIAWWFSSHHCFQKTVFSCFLSTLKPKFPPVEKGFRKTLEFDVDSRPNHRIKLHFQISPAQCDRSLKDKSVTIYKKSEALEPRPAHSYRSFCSMKRLEVFLLPLDGMLVHRRSHPRNLSGFPNNFPLPICTPGWREALWE